MDKSNGSQILKLSLIFSLFISTPLIPTMFRSPYLFFIVNLLVVALGTEAGLVSFFSKSGDQDKEHVNTTLTNIPFIVNENSNNNHEIEEIVKPLVLVEKYSSEKIVVGVVNMTSNMKKCLSTPSIFFIGNGESDSEDVIEEEDEEQEQEKDDDEEDQELLMNAEKFIGKFYKQLNMQRTGFME